MSNPKTPHVGYVVKRYPRFSETFVVNEILAHEQAGINISIFALRAPVDSHFQAEIGRVRAPVTYLPGARSVRSRVFWRTLKVVMRELPGATEVIEGAGETDPCVVYQAMELALQVRDRGIHHLHAHFATSATSVARLAARLAGIRYTFTAHAKDIFHEEVDDRDLRIKLSQASSVVTVSDFNVADLRRRFGRAAEGVSRIYNGLDLSDFPFAAGPRPSGRILAVGRLVEKKGFPFLVKACAELRARGTPFQCRIVGAGDGRAELEALIRDLEVEDLVELVGPLPRQKVLDELKRSTLLAAPCIEASTGDRDGLPTVLLEAMALGVPCVSTPVTGIPELVDDGVTGLLVPPRDPEALAHASERLLADQELAGRLARHARRRIEESFDVRRNAALLRTHFELKQEVQTHAA